ncbi:MAG: CPBP family intramembrane metalloprotease [Clostridia bacterium]|nr:CPBP family intramembrane metalloprotease [Clostridia bacterium]
MKIKNTFLAPWLAIVALALITAIRYIDPAMLARRDNIYLSLVILQFLILLLPAVFYTRLKGKGYVSTLGLKMFMPDSIAFILIATIAIIAGSAALRFLLELINIPRSDTVLMRKIFSDISPASSPMFSLVAYALTPAVIEEFMFRGVLLTEYKSGGRICAVVMSSLLFALVHYGFENFILSFFIGVMLAFTYYVTGSVWSCVFIRLAYNIYTVFLESQLFAVLDRPNNSVFMIFIFLGLFLISLVLLLGCAEKMFYSYALSGRDPGTRDDSFVTGKVSFKSSLSSIPFLFCLLLYIIVSL